MYRTHICTVTEINTYLYSDFRQPIADEDAVSTLNGEFSVFPLPASGLRRGNR